jgi:hypothetical protein
VPAGKLKEKNMKSLKKRVGSGAGSISQMCGSGSTDPQHCCRISYPYQSITNAFSQKIFIS